MSGTNSGVSLDCPTTLANECWKIPGYRYVTYDNSAATPCGVSKINGTDAGICGRPNVRITSWIINGRNVIADPFTDGWDNCGVPFLSDLAATLNTWDPFAGGWTVAVSDSCAYFIRSRALPPTGTKYGVLTAVDIDSGETLTFTPVDTVVADQFFRRITEVDCSGTSSVRWVNDAGTTVAAPDPAQIVECSVQTAPGARPTPTQRVRPRIQRYTGTQSSIAFDSYGADPQSVTLTVLAGAVRVQAAGSGATSTNGGPTTYADDVTVPAGITLTWAVDGDTTDLALDGALQFTGTAAGADFIVHWTEHIYTDSD
ncbi:hypothetical protein AB0N14_18005 [Streptomyces sp. NPDC051104]|uniref:hypothetical protein n=1 Tax=Streptomyces sp. NPDC051104 TaxID=3155044 RepID=UPI00342EC737